LLHYYDVTNNTKLVVDASPVGVGALLVQTDKDDNEYCINYASRSLNEVEQRYSQIEREALAITWAIKHFNLYLEGAKFTVLSDHKPLESIFNNTRSTAPVRIQRWLL